MNIKYTFLLFLSCIIQNIVNAQITVVAKDLKGDKVFLTQAKYGTNYVLDTITMQESTIKVPKEILQENNFYGLIFPTLNFENLNFLYLGNPIKIEFNAKSLFTSVKFEVGDSSNLAIYEDLGLNAPLLDELLTLEENIIPIDSINFKKSNVINQIRLNREKVLLEYKHTLWYKVLQLDQGAELPYYNHKKYRPLYKKYDGYNGNYNNFFNNIYLKNDVLVSTFLYGKRIKIFIEEPINWNSDSLIFYMDSLLSITKKSRMLYEYTLELFFNRFNTLGYHQIEKAMIHFWNFYLKDETVESIDMLEKWKFGKIINIREHTKLGKKIADFEVRDESFKKVTLKDMEGEKRILVFWNPNLQAHWGKIAYWRDDFNESSIYNEGFRLIFIGVKNDEYSWLRVIDKLQINDKPNYLNRLNDPNLNNFFNSDIKLEYPLTYLIDDNGIVLDKFKKNILDYSKFTY